MAASGDTSTTSRLAAGTTDTLINFKLKIRMIVLHLLPTRERRVPLVYGASLSGTGTRPTQERHVPRIRVYTRPLATGTVVLKTHSTVVQSGAYFVLLFIGCSTASHQQRFAQSNLLVSRSPSGPVITAVLHP